MLNIISGMDTCYTGKYFYEDHILKRSEATDNRRQNIGIITQNYNLLNDRNVYHNVAIGIQHLRTKAGFGR